MFWKLAEGLLTADHAPILTIHMAQGFSQNKSFTKYRRCTQHIFGSSDRSLRLDNTVDVHVQCKEINNIDR